MPAPTDPIFPPFLLQTVSMVLALVDLTEVGAMLHNRYQTSIYEVLVGILTSSADEHKHAAEELIQQSEVIVQLLCTHPKHGRHVLPSLCSLAAQTYRDELEELVHPRTGWHLNALRAQAEQIEGWDITEMASRMQINAPSLWGLIHSLMSRGGANANASKENEEDEEDVEAHRQSLDDPDIPQDDDDTDHDKDELDEQEPEPERGETQTRRRATIMAVRVA
jgi:hypothetical protein